MISMFNECKILYILFGMYIELFLKYQTCKGFLYMVIKVDPIGDSNIIFLNTDSTLGGQKTRLTCYLGFGVLRNEIFH